MGSHPLPIHVDLQIVQTAIRPSELYKICNINLCTVLRKMLLTFANIQWVVYLNFKLKPRDIKKVGSVELYQLFVITAFLQSFLWNSYAKWLTKMSRLYQEINPLNLTFEFKTFQWTVHHICGGSTKTAQSGFWHKYALKDKPWYRF